MGMRRYQNSSDGLDIFNVKRMKTENLTSFWVLYINAKYYCEIKSVYLLSYVFNPYSKYYVTVHISI